MNRYSQYPPGPESQPPSNGSFPDSGGPGMPPYYPPPWEQGPQWSQCPPPPFGFGGPGRGRGRGHLPARAGAAATSPSHLPDSHSTRTSSRIHISSGPDMPDLLHMGRDLDLCPSRIPQTLPKKISHKCRPRVANICSQV
eukprot:61513_1